MIARALTSDEKVVVRFIGGAWDGQARLVPKETRGARLVVPLVLAHHIYLHHEYMLADEHTAVFFGEVFADDLGPTRRDLNRIERPQNERKMLCFLKELQALTEKWGVDLESGSYCEENPRWRIGGVRAELDDFDYKPNPFPDDDDDYDEWSDDD